MERMAIFRLICIILVFFATKLVESAHKVRYYKAGKSSRSPDIFQFLGQLQPSGDKIQFGPYENSRGDETSIQFSIPFPPTTTMATPTTTSTTSKSNIKQTIHDYCLKARGLFSYDLDCHKYVNCWNSRAILSTCYPTNLVFNPSTGQCTWAFDIQVQGRCTPDRNARPAQNQIDVEETSSLGGNNTQIATDFSLPNCDDFTHLGYECVDTSRCIDGEITDKAQESIIFYAIDVRSGLGPPKGKFSPWMKKCPDYPQICCKNSQKKAALKTAASTRSRNLLKPSLCPNQHTGLLPYPSDCSKFVNCWKGRSHVQDCAPGTEYNQNLGQCDFPSKAKCRPKVQDLPEPLHDAVIQARSSLPIDGFVQPSPPSGQKVRLRGGKGPFAGYLEMSKNNEWGLVCDAGTWTIDEARLVCKDLGFARGVRSTTQGLIYGPVDESRKISEEVTCRGDETSFDQCDVVYSSPNTGGSCKLASEIVSIRCAIDSTAVCLEGEIPWGDSCYSLYFNRSTFHEAQETCQRDGKYLAEITDQQENDILSELLIQNRLSPGLLAEVWTGGIGGGNRRSPLYYWHGSRQKIGMFRNWWPGWSGERKGIDLQGSSKAVKLSRKFDFVQKYKKEEKLTDYYFWALDDFRARLAFLCERKQAEIGCIEGQGESYRGNANIGESGDPCMPWDSPQLSFVLDPHLIPNLGPLNGNNFCRNPDGDSAPWCIAPNGEFDYCDIPQCKDQEHTPIDLPDIIDQEQKVSTCKGNQFQCDTDQTECILSVYVCDGHDDCSNRADELNCQGREIDKYATYEGQRLAVPYLERWLHQTVEACALHCKNARGFDCKSFSYQKERRICTLHAVTVGTTGKLKLDFQWDYYELKKEASNCPKYLQCPNLKCLSENQICDGKFDCGEGSTFDEKSCETKPNLEIRLTDGKTTSEGKIEIRAFDYPFGGICDDGFGLAEANVVCRQLGFTQGALEALNNLAGIRQRPIVLDEVQCQGNESSLLECSFQPWMQHDCQANEWAGVRCKDHSRECNTNENQQWQCQSGECVPYDFLCDGRSDCSDGSDESRAGFCEEPLAVRLINGNNETSGRVEVKFNGIWGTVCDDNFGPEEGAVICRMLGFEGKAVVHSEGAYGPGGGPIWIQNVVCEGNEESLAKCKSPTWSPTYQCKHLEDVGVECVPFAKDQDHDYGSYGAAGRMAPQCGTSTVKETPAVPVARIAAGMQSRPGAHPWSASIRLQGTQKSFHWCGAVVISEFHVLTAGHCMEDYPKDSYRVRVGDWDMQVPDLQEQEFKVDTVYFHEGYNVGLYLNNDIAVVRIKASLNTGRGFRFGDRVVPACLPHSNVVYGTHLNCSVYGWGSTGVHQPGFTRYLQAATIPLLDTDKCVSPTVYGPNKLGGSMFCAGFLEGGVDTCQGDSGGGMLCEVRGRQAIMGLTSWGYGCGRPNRPGVYTKVADYLDWITDKLEGGSA